MTAEQLDRFITKLDVTLTGCWEWVGAKNNRGYGMVNQDRRVQLAHRVLYEHFRGAIPEGLHLDHLCRNRPCANPAHLEPVTQAENQKRGLVNQHKNKTHCKRGHEFTPDNTHIQPATAGCRYIRRFCIVCTQERNRDSIDGWRKQAEYELSVSVLL